MSKILVAESDPFFLKFYSVKLKQLGHEVEKVEEGRQAIEKLKTEPYDAILMNLMLPYQDGFAVLDAKNATKNKGIPVIVVTELQQDEDREKAEALGINYYFIKNQAQVKDIMNAVRALFGENAEEEVPGGEKEESEEGLEEAVKEANEVKEEVKEGVKEGVKEEIKEEAVKPVQSTKADESGKEIKKGKKAA